jgi:NAD(P)-dependent dehydrogenase (short-subunit alcohol dehydrogenase family)
MARREFRGKVVVVTGAAGGLGKALAARFAARGARVALLDRDGVAAEAAAAGLGAGALGLQCDVSDAGQCASALARAAAALGPVHVLINNAGISHRSAYAATDPAVIRRVMEVNFFGAVNCTRAALADLVRTRGLIVAISSVAGFSPLIARTGYAASKHALHGFFDSLRTELEPLGVRVMLVCPSFIQTGIERNALDGQGLAARHPQAIVGVRASPEAIADRIFQAARHERRLLLPDRVSRASWWVSRLAPKLYARLMVAKLKKEMQPGGR